MIVSKNQMKLRRECWAWTAWRNTCSELLHLLLMYITPHTLLIFTWVLNIFLRNSIASRNTTLARKQQFSQKPHKHIRCPLMPRDALTWSRAPPLIPLYTVLLQLFSTHGRDFKLSLYFRSGLIEAGWFDFNLLFPSICKALCLETRKFRFFFLSLRLLFVRFL